MKPLIHKQDTVIGVIEHPNGRTYHIKYLDDNAENARFVVADAQTGKRLGGFETYAKAVKAAQSKDKDITDPVYRHPDKSDLKIEPATEEEIQQALARVFPRSELTRQLDALKPMEGVKVEGELKKIRQTVYSFAQLTKPRRKFTVRPAGDNGWLLVIRIN